MQALREVELRDGVNLSLRDRHGGHLETVPALSNDEGFRQ